MRYLGGKSVSSKHIVAQMISRHPAGQVWEPFCGGLSMTRRLVSAGYQVHCSDWHLPLISMYRAVQGGWLPPETVSKEEYAAAKRLPDTDPLKAFIGFGCSFGGKWFGGYAKPTPTRPRNDAAESRRAVLKEASLPASVNRINFLGVEPRPLPGVVLYLDPPYRGTTGYSTGGFDHDLFDRRCLDWQSEGTPIFISEYDFPYGECIWTKTVRSTVSRDKSEKLRTEKLFYLKP